jgi:hypothetical protein
MILALKGMYNGSKDVHFLTPPYHLENAIDITHTIYYYIHP